MKTDVGRLEIYTLAHIKVKLRHSQIREFVKVFVLYKNKM